MPSEYSRYKNIQSKVSQQSKAGKVKTMKEPFSALQIITLPTRLLKIASILQHMKLQCDCDNIPKICFVLINSVFGSSLLSSFPFNLSTYQHLHLDLMSLLRSFHVNFTILKMDCIGNLKMEGENPEHRLQKSNLKISQTVLYKTKSQATCFNHEKSYFPGQ